MVTLDGKPLVDESAARLDLATEYGILFANYRNVMLEAQALAAALQASNNELQKVRESCVQLGEKLRDMTTLREKLAESVRPKAPIKVK